MRLIPLLFVAMLARGQVTTGSITGYVHDPSSRAIAGARVTAVDPSRSLTRSISTDLTGFYRFVNLPPSSYRLTVSAKGFSEASLEDVAPAVGSTMRADFRLVISGEQTSISVRSAIRLIPTESSELGAVMDQSRIANLPLNRRDFLQLALLAPGVAPPVQDSELSTRGSFAMHANGAREEFNNFLLDGVDNNDPNVNRYVLQPPIDAIQEFKVATNTYGAEYGRGGGAQVNVITQSGTNQWHGFLYEYLRNRALDNRNFFDTGDSTKYVRNQFGVGAGGPLVRNKTFFFADFDGLRERRGLSHLSTVPNPQERAGDLSRLPVTVVDSFTRTPFPGNRVPSSRIAPLSAKVFDLFPLPNLQGGAGNHLGQPVLRDTQSQSNVRADHDLTSADRLTLRYSYGRKNLFEPFAEESTNVPGFGDFLKDSGHNAMVHHQRALGARAVNSLLVGLNRATRKLLPENFTQDVNKLWGVSWLPSAARDFGYPGLTVAGYSRIGDVTQLPIDRAVTTYHLSEAFSLVRGNHAWKLGAEIRRIQMNGSVHVLTRGSLTFSGALSGAGVADLLLGLPSLGIQSQADNYQAQRTSAYHFYIQDDWKLRPRLTLNVGLRYEYNLPVTDAHDRMSILDPATGRLVQVGTGAFSRSGVRSDRNNFAPRFGFAWNATPGFVVRGGYGWYYDSGMTVVNSSLYFNPPYFSIRVFFPTATSLLTLQDPFPSKGGFTPPPALNTLSPDLTTTSLQHWNLNLQRELNHVGTVSLAYAGSKGSHLIRARDLNQPRPGAGPVGARSPYPSFSNIFLAESGANSNYHSFQGFLNRSLVGGLSLLGSYTLSKSIDDSSAFLSTKPDRNFPQDSRNYRAERAVSSFDVRHRATLAFDYHLPGRQPLLRGWEMRGILSAFSGQPFTPILRFDNSNTGNTGGVFGSDRPNLLHNPRLQQPEPARWFDPSAFSTPSPYTFGSAGRNVLRGPGFFTLDAALARPFVLRERVNILLEAQVFNLLNRANFDLPERYQDEPGAFARIFSAKPSRQIQVVLRLRF